MKLISVFSSILLLSINVFSQINMQESAVQVIGYWVKNETQTYKMTFEKYKVNNGDTLKRNLMSYAVDIKIVDSTANSYTIEWFYKDFNIDSENKMARKMASIAEDMSVLIKTDEFGVVQGIVNWEEVRDKMQKGANELKKEMKDIPFGVVIMDQMMAMYSTKESIEANAIKDAHQFYTFHGGKYELGEVVEGRLQRPNNFGGRPFDVDVTLSLDKINEEDGNSIIRMHQVTDSKQLTDATYGFMEKSGNLGNDMPQRSSFSDLSSESWTASQIHGPSGWIIYSIETKVTSSDGQLNVEERIIDLQ